MSCSDRYASAAEYFAFFCGSEDCSNPEEESIVNEFLEKAAGDIHAALAAAGACDCTGMRVRLNTLLSFVVLKIVLTQKKKALSTSF